MNARGSLISYRPRNDFLFSLNKCPLLLIEISSEKDESDRYRLLVQAGTLVRVMNSIQNENWFVCVAVYITRTFDAERFLVYQPDQNTSRV